VQNEFIVSNVDGVTCIGSTLVPGDHMHALREDIDDLALPFIAPLATHHHHAVPGVFTSKHGTIPRWRGPKGLRYKEKSPFRGEWDLDGASFSKS
jgi:hypothetical protein